MFFLTWFVQNPRDFGSFFAKEKPNLFTSVKNKPVRLKTKGNDISDSALRSSSCYENRRYNSVDGTQYKDFPPTTRSQVNDENPQSSPPPSPPPRRLDLIFSSTRARLCYLPCLPRYLIILKYSSLENSHF